MQTNDNLIVLTQKAMEATNYDEKMIGIFFDIASAFDKVWHQGLLYKLAEINTPYYIIKIVGELPKNRMF